MSIKVTIETDPIRKQLKNIYKCYAMSVLQLNILFKRLNSDFPLLDLNRLSAKKLIENSRFFAEDIWAYIRDEENIPFLLIPVGKEDLVRRLDRLVSGLHHSNSQNLTSKRLLDIVSRTLSNFIGWFEYFQQYVDREKESEKLIKSLKDNVQQAKEQAKNFETAIQALNAEESVVVYTSASANFVERARAYELLFYLLLGGAILFTTVHLCYVPFSGNEINFILVKVLTLSVVVTLGTLFLRKSAHFHKLYDQAHQTSLELKALPLYLKNVEKEHHSDIYKDLASKYFGKDIDPSQNDKIGDLIKDQLTAGTELIKASAEMVKGVKTSFGSATTTEQTKSVKPSSTEE